MAVVGLGYVGLPLALTFAEAGFPTLGFDIDRRKIEALGAGESYVGHIAGSRIDAARADGRFSATADFDRLTEADAILICVPTPLKGEREPDLRFVESTVREIRRRLRPGHLVVLESTTYPGTTDEIVRPELDRAGLECDRDYFLAYSPERENPGTEHRTATVPKVVGGVGAASGDLAEALYASVVTSVVRVSSCRVAEATKLTENVFRAVNIALVNELKLVFEKLGVDVWEVLDAAATKPFGFMRFDPGPGLGGHCIPIDPFYLAWQAERHGARARFVELAGEINTSMPAYVVNRLDEEIEAAGGRLEDSRVLLLGLAYKSDVDDPRESPAFAILDLLHRRGSQVAYHDPHILEAPSMRSWPELPPLRSIPLRPEAIAEFDAVVIVTDHTAVDYETVAAHARLVLDTRNVYSRQRPNVKKA
ncbi:MAG: nucleotide sugar dehydrogenase [Thermoanaerobaculia bacterium]|nr:nucleotide sugar dehydrogenase [Thermoanaerobaculia bacterium]